MVFKSLMEWSNAQWVSALITMILPTTVGTYHGLNYFSHVIYTLQTSTYHNIVKLFDSPKYKGTLWFIYKKIIIIINYSNVEFLTSYSTIAWLHHLDFIKRLREKAKWELLKDAACCFEKIQEAASHKTVAVRLPTSYFTNHPSKTCWELQVNQVISDAYTWIHQC